MAVLPFPMPQGVNFSIGSNRSVKAHVLKAPFGNRYTQKAGDGLNSVVSTFNITIVALTKAEADAIEAFLTERAGWQRFSFEGKIWTCEEWEIEYTGSIHQDFKAKFEQEFTA